MSDSEQPTPAEIEAARAVRQTHKQGKDHRRRDTGLCVRCFKTWPCEEAEQARIVLMRAAGLD